MVLWPHFNRFIIISLPDTLLFQYSLIDTTLNQCLLTGFTGEMTGEPSRIAGESMRSIGEPTRLTGESTRSIGEPTRLTGESTRSTGEPTRLTLEEVECALRGLVGGTVTPPGESTFVAGW